MQMGARKESKQREACAKSKECGACQLLHVPYEVQLAEKHDEVERLFGSDANPTIGMDEPFHYRKKVTSPFAPGEDGKVRTGMYKAGTHELVDVSGCLIEDEVGAAVIAQIKRQMQRWKVPPYDEDAQTGFLRHAVVRVGAASGEVLVVLVTNGKEFPHSKNFCRELKKAVPEVTSVVQNVNTRNTNVILGEGYKALYGPGFIFDELCGLKFRISPTSFFQVNPEQAAKLYEESCRMAKLEEGKLVIDAYCGCGTIGCIAAARGAGRVIGVESVASAVRDARMNAEHNGIESAEFIEGDAGDVLGMIANGSMDATKRIDVRDVASDDIVLMMDPPRSGASEEFLKAACKLGPGRIVYISCNPKTQKRDVDMLLESGYFIEEIQPVDMFPHTEHIESIVSLSRLGSN